MNNGMSNVMERRPACVVCGTETVEVLDLGRQPFANELHDRADAPFEAFDLGLAACPACSHGQLTHFVDPAKLFSHYLYASGTSGTLNDYFDWFSRSLRQFLPASARVLEIACNDGSLLAKLAVNEFSAVGVDPAANLTATARSRGFDVRTGFFPQTAPEGTFDAVIAMNVLAHTPDPAAILGGIRGALAPNGIAFVQTSQAMMLENAEFDTIYHEHYSFFTPRSMQKLCARVGLRLESIVLTAIHGGSAVFVLRHLEAPRIAALPWVDARFLLDPNAGSSRPDYPVDVESVYRRFALAAAATMQVTSDAIARHRRMGRPIALAGVAAKSMTFIRAAGIEPDVYLDEAELKIGRFVPGTSKAIEPFARASTLPEGTVFLVGAWNFAAEITSKLRRLRPGAPFTTMTAFPSLTESTEQAACGAS